MGRLLSKTTPIHPVLELDRIGLELQLLLEKVGADEFFYIDRPRCAVIALRMVVCTVFKETLCKLAAGSNGARLVFKAAVTLFM